MNKAIINLSLMAVLSFLVSACGLADLRTPAQKDGLLESDSSAKGKELLHHAIVSQGLDRMDRHQVYEVKAEDHWQGLFGTLGKLWPDSKAALQFRFDVGSFDSQVTFLDGKKEGMTAGLQDWNYYEQARNGEVEFMEKANKKHRFGLSAFHYFFELPNRLASAEIVKYVGEKKWRGQVYDQVFISWGEEQPHDLDDQYLAWINKSTGLLEVCEFTIRDAYLPGPKGFFGTILYRDYREVEGVSIPFQQVIFKNKAGKNESDYLHQLTVESFEFDSFDKDILYPSRELGMSADAKPK